jgi:hypothetical protein
MQKHRSHSSSGQEQWGMPRVCLTLLITPRHCMSSSIVSLIYTMVHSDGMSVVIVLHSRDVSVRNPSNSWYLLSFRFELIAAIASCNFGAVSWTYGCSTSGGVTSVTGTQCTRRDPFLSFWLQKVAFRTLVGTSWQSQTRAWTCRVLWEGWPLDLVSTLKGLSN